jgi:hypothetical protein
MPFQVSMRLGDAVVVSEVNSAEAALERASAWTRTYLGKVTIALDGGCFAISEFAAVLENKTYDL